MSSYPSPEASRRLIEKFFSHRGEGEASTSPGLTGDGDPASADPRRASALPEIPNYDLIEEVGRGGMGVVYEGYQQSTGRRVAVKFVSEHVVSRDSVRRRFEREVELVARLQHPGIVSVLDSGTHGGSRFCVQEFVDGVTLDAWLAQTAGEPSALPAGERLDVVLGLLTEVCDAVEYAHQRGVLHRDLKPSNILIDSSGHPHIVDFGLAKDIDPLASQWREQTVAEPGEILGTLGYMAPEQARGNHEHISIRSDLYSLGAIAYQALTGQLPCPTNGTLQEALARIEQQDPPRPSSINRSLSADLGAVLLKALDKKPERRYASAREMRDDIRRVLSREPVRARPVGRLMRTARWARRRPSQAALLTALVLFVVSGVASAMWLNARHTDTARAVEEDLRQIAHYQQRSSWVEARSILERAQVRIGNAYGFGALRDRIDVAGRNLTLIARLDAIRMERANFVGVEPSIAPQIDSDYDQAFTQAGFAIYQGQPDEMSAQIGSSDIRGPIINAVMDWATFTADEPLKDRLERIISRVDPDAWRGRMQDPEAWQDPTSRRVGADGADSGLPVQTLVALGERLHARDIDAAPFLRRVQRRHPDDFWANFYLGTALVSNPPEAIAYYRAALAPRPNASPVHNNLAMLLAETGHHDEAFDHFEAAARLTDYPSAHLNLANALRRKGDNAQAIMHYERALQGGLTTYALHHNYAAALKEGGRVEEAIAQYREALKLNRRVPALHVEIAHGLAELGKVDEAVSHVREAARLAPSDYAVLGQLHPLLLRQQKWEEARAAWKNTLEAEPPDHRVWYGYAELCLYLGQEAEYRLARAELLRRFADTTDPFTAERTGRACLLLPPSSSEDMLKAAALCDRAAAVTEADAVPYRPYFLFAKGLAEYRQEHPDRVVEIMKGEAGAVLGPAPQLVTAMALHRQGKRDEAAQALAAGIESFDWSETQATADPSVWVFHILRREAEALFQPKLAGNPSLGAPVPK